MYMYRANRYRGGLPPLGTKKKRCGDSPPRDVRHTRYQTTLLEVGMKYGITAILILLSYGLPALAQENPWPPLLGAPRPADLVRSPKYGIAIQTNGYNRPIKAKKIIRTERWLTNMGADQLVDPFASYVDLVTGDGEELINETDVVVETVIKPAWYSCGPEWQARFDSIDWSKAFITIEPEPFWLTGTTGGNDWFPAATDENNIRVAILTVSY